MRLYLINPRNPTISLVHVKKNRLNKYRIWKPLGLLILARLTPQDWDVTVIDENREEPDYATMPRPDLVGLTAFTSQAERAYEIATEFRVEAANSPRLVLTKYPHRFESRHSRCGIRKLVRKKLVQQNTK